MCIHACMYVCMYAGTYLCMYVCTYVCMCVYMYVCSFVAGAAATGVTVYDVIVHRNVHTLAETSGDTSVKDEVRFVPTNTYVYIQVHTYICMYITTLHINTCIPRT